MDHPAEWSHKLPEGMSHEFGALAEPLSVGIQTCKRAQVRTRLAMVLSRQSPVQHRLAAPQSSSRDAPLLVHQQHPMWVQLGPYSRVAVLGAGPIGLNAALAAQAFGVARLVITDIRRATPLLAPRAAQRPDGPALPCTWPTSRRLILSQCIALAAGMLQILGARYGQPACRNLWGACSKARLEFARKMGLGDALLTGRQDSPKHVAQQLRAAVTPNDPGMGPDVVLDCAGTSQTLQVRPARLL